MKFWLLATPYGISWPSFEKTHNKVGLWHLAGWWKKAVDSSLWQALKAPHLHRRRNHVCHVLFVLSTPGKATSKPTISFCCHPPMVNLRGLPAKKIFHSKIWNIISLQFTRAAVILVVKSRCRKRPASQYCVHCFVNGNQMFSFTWWLLSIWYSMLVQLFCARNARKAQSELNDAQSEQSACFLAAATAFAQCPELHDLCAAVRSARKVFGLCGASAEFQAMHQWTRIRHGLETSWNSAKS